MPARRRGSGDGGGAGLADGSVTYVKLDHAIQPRILPALPSEGSRDGRFPAFGDDALEWRTLLQVLEGLDNDAVWAALGGPPLFERVFQGTVRDVDNAPSVQGFTVLNSADVQYIITATFGGTTNTELIAGNELSGFDGSSASERRTFANGLFVYSDDGDLVVENGTGGNAALVVWLVRSASALTPLVAAIPVTLARLASGGATDGQFLGYNGSAWGPTDAPAPADGSIVLSKLAAAVQGLLLPAFPAAGSRDGKDLGFAGNVLGWNKRGGGVRAESITFTNISQASGGVELAPNVGSATVLYGSSGSAILSGLTSGDADFTVAAGAYAVQIEGSSIGGDNDASFASFTVRKSSDNSVLAQGGGNNADSATATPAIAFAPAYLFLDADTEINIYINRRQGVGITGPKMTIVALGAASTGDGGSTPPVSMHNRLIGWSAAPQPTVAEVNAAVVETDDTLAIPSRDSNGYVFFGVPANPGAPNAVYLDGNTHDQLAAYSKRADRTRAGTGAGTYLIWSTTARQNAAILGTGDRTLTLSYATR